MISNIRSIPFFIDNVYNGFAKVEGLLTAHSDRLELEFMTKDTFVGALKSKAKSETLYLSDIISVVYKKNWFVSRMHIKVMKLSLLDNFPKSDQNELILKINRKNKDVAKSVESYINLRISEIRLDNMEDELREREDW